MSIRFMWGGFSTVHDVSLVHGSNTLSAVSLGVVECITSDTLGSLPGNKLDRLNNAIDNLKFGSDKPVSSRLLH